MSLCAGGGWGQLADAVDGEGRLPLAGPVGGRGGALPGGVEAGGAGAIHVVAGGVANKEDGGRVYVEPLGGEAKDVARRFWGAGGLGRDDGGDPKGGGVDGGGDIIRVTVGDDGGWEPLGDGVDGVDGAGEWRGLGDAGHRRCRDAHWPVGRQG